MADENIEEQEFVEKKASEVLLEISEMMENFLQYSKDLKFKYELLLQQNQRIEKLLKSHIDAHSHANVIEKKEAVISSPEIISTTSVSSPKVKRVVKQKVVYPDTINQDKPLPVIIATVKIYNVDKKLINEKIRTDPKGVWSTSLEPGDYFYHITKGPQGKKPLVDIYKPFSVPAGSTDPIELPFIL